MDALDGGNPVHSPLTMTTILQALNGIRYGSVEITVHESRVVQIERKEKFRLDAVGGDKAKLTKSA